MCVCIYMWMCCSLLVIIKGRKAWSTYDPSTQPQGCIQETLSLSRLKGFDVGGTVHLVVNNQVNERRLGGGWESL